MSLSRPELLDRIERLTARSREIRRQLEYDNAATDNIGWWTCECGRQTRNPTCPRCGKPKPEINP